MWLRRKEEEEEIHISYNKQQQQHITHVYIYVTVIPWYISFTVRLCDRRFRFRFRLLGRLDRILLLLIGGLPTTLKSVRHQPVGTGATTTNPRSKPKTFQRKDHGTADVHVVCCPRPLHLLFRQRRLPKGDVKTSSARAGSPTKTCPAPCCG